MPESVGYTRRGIDAGAKQPPRQAERPPRKNALKRYAARNVSGDAYASESEVIARLREEF